MDGAWLGRVEGSELDKLLGRFEGCVDGTGDADGLPLGSAKGVSEAEGLSLR